MITSAGTDPQEVEVDAEMVELLGPGGRKKTLLKIGKYSKPLRF
jgi:hypothetical protein